MALNREKLQQDMEKSKSERGGSGINFVGKGTLVLRVLEFTDQDGDQQFARKVVKWGSTGAGNKRKDLCVHRSATFGEDVPDAVQAYGDLLASRGQDSPYTARKQYFVNGIDVNAKQKKVEIWGLPTSVWEQISVVAINEQWSDVLEPETGHAFVIVGTGDGLDREYTVTVDRNPWPVSAELMQQVIDPLEKAVDVGLEAQCRLLGVSMEEIFPDGVELENVDSMTGPPPAAETPAPPPPTRSTPPATTRTAPAAGGAPARQAQGGTSRAAGGPPAPRPLPPPSRTAPTPPVAPGNKPAASGGLIRGLARGAGR
jgi:hypothetical protein